MPKGKGYGNKSKKSSKDHVNAKVEKATRGGVSGKNLGALRAKPGAKTTMSRSGAMGGKNPNAQTSKPKRTHKIKKALK